MEKVEDPCMGIYQKDGGVYLPCVWVNTGNELFYLEEGGTEYEVYLQPQAGHFKLYSATQRPALNQK